MYIIVSNTMYISLIFPKNDTMYMTTEAIIYKHKADFASSTELTVLGGGAPEAAELINDGHGAVVTASSGKAPNGAKAGSV